MKLIYLFLLISSYQVFAGTFKWDVREIPGAKCGDGTPYKIFYKKGNSSKVAIELMGGGACWDLATCWGPNLRTWIHQIPAIPAFSYLTTSDSPIKNHTLVYLPYCNGDVFIGRHIADYSSKLKTYHHGYLNVIKTFEYLKDEKLISFEKLDQFIFYGSSAGGIGALFHTKTAEKYLSPQTKKLLIADSIGLHFGKKFWEKFPQKFINDFKSSFDEIGMNVDFTDGFVAPELRHLCQRSSDWQMGFIQTTRDIVMSLIFGNISQKEHKSLVLGQDGIKNLFKSSRNCKSLIPDGQGHAILIIPQVAKYEKDMSTGVSAIEFVNQLINNL
ncbi:MAG: pectin acetylesterase-family hydrolase [Bacteriovoracaceae bacterium]